MAYTSRNALTSIVQMVDPTTGKATQPPFIDLRPRVTKEFPDDRFVTVDSSMSWGSLGLSMESDARNWWVMADVSGVVDPFTELIPGTRLRAPAIPRFLFDIMGNRR